MKKLTAELLLFCTALIWGFAFVSQRQGMQSLDPFLFNGLRFALGALVVGLLCPSLFKSVTTFRFPWLPGIALFLAAGLQQTGLVWTTAGNAGFITGLYIVFVPILGLFRRQCLGFYQLAAIFLAISGLYLLSIKQGLQINPGDLLVLLSSVFWAWHVQLIDAYTRRMDTFALAFGQAAFCSLASLICALLYYLILNPALLHISSLLPRIQSAALPLLYNGILSVGVAYTLQVSAQKIAPPLPAAIILCLESVFAMLGGWLLLHETVSLRMLTGAGLMLAAMLWAANLRIGRSDRI